MEEPRDDDYDDEDYAISNDDDDDGWNLLKIQYGTKNVTINQHRTALNLLKGLKSTPF